LAVNITCRWSTPYEDLTIQHVLQVSPANRRTGATMTNNRPSFGFAKRRSISVPPRSAIDTGT
jgi:hypothetical protein